jgi:hypothetical protein
VQTHLISLQPSPQAEVEALNFAYKSWKSVSTFLAITTHW